MEGFILPKFSLKTFDACNKAVSRSVLQEKPEFWAGVLHIAEEIQLNRRKIVALSARGALLETMTWLSGWVTDWAPVPPEISVLCQ